MTMSPYSTLKKGRKKWFEELREHQNKDIETDALMPREYISV
jgi:hypothetical protein